MELNITITNTDKVGKWFTASLQANRSFTNNPPPHEATGSTPQEALANLISMIDVTETMAAETGVDPAIVSTPSSEYVCADCGSNQVESYAWVPMNGTVNRNNTEFVESHTWCDGCETVDLPTRTVNHYPNPKPNPTLKPTQP